MKIGIMEIGVILIVALFVIGPDQLPKYARMAGKALAEFKKSTADIQKEMNDAMEPIKEATQIFKEAGEDIQDIKGEVVETINKPYADKEAANEETKSE